MAVKTLTVQRAVNVLNKLAQTQPDELNELLDCEYSSGLDLGPLDLVNELFGNKRGQQGYITAEVVKGRVVSFKAIPHRNTKKPKDPAQEGHKRLAEESQRLQARRKK